MDLDERILEELIYERTKVAVDLWELLALKQNLSASVRRALESCTSSEEQRSAMARRCLARAWRRVGREVQRELVAADIAELGGAGPGDSALGIRPGGVEAGDAGSTALLAAARAPRRLPPSRPAA